MTNPIPYTYTLLILALPGLVLLGRRLTDWMEHEPEVRQAVAPFAALGSWILVVGAFGRVASSFRIGVAAGTVALAAAGVVWTLRFRKPPAASPSTSGASALRVAAIALLATLPVAWLTLSSDFFDDFNLIGHRSLVAQFQNDSFPPRHQVYPDYPLRYHYGFNLVAAGLTAMLRLPDDVAIDLVVILGFYGAFFLAWRLGERLTASGSGVWTAVGALFTGGAFYGFVWYSDWAQHDAVGIVIGGNRTNFPVLMYFFQKPFALGFPLALAAILVASVPSEPGAAWRRGVLLSLLLAPLSLAQVVLFVTVGASLAAQDLVDQRRPVALLPYAAALILAVPLGGVLFTSLPAPTGGLLQARFWMAHYPPLEVLLWLFLTTGILIPMGILGTFWMRRLRLFFLLLIAGSFCVPFLFHDPRSWDIVKFATVGQFAAGLAAGVALARIARSELRFRAFVLAALTSMLVASPVGYFTTWAREVLWPTPELGKILAAQREPLRNTDWLRIIDWLRATGPTDGVVYSRDFLLERRLLFAGLYTAGPPGGINPQFGVAAERIATRRSLLERLPDGPEPWLDEGVVWFVTGPGDPMRATLSSWVEAGRARHAAISGNWSVYRLLTENPSRSVP